MNESLVKSALIQPRIKRVLLIFLLLLLGVSTFCSAQKGLQVGVRFIPQSTSFMFNTGFPLLDILKVSPYYSRFRTAQGLGVTYHPHDRWSIGADLLYSLHGGGYESRTTNVNYIRLPFLLGYNASTRHRLMFNIQTGVDFAYLVNANMKYSDGTTTDISSYVNRTNWGIPFAMGFKFRVAKQFYVNSQLYIYSDFRTLSKTNPAFGVKDYILPGFRFSIDRQF